MSAGHAHTGTRARASRPRAISALRQGTPGSLVSPPDLHVAAGDRVCPSPGVGRVASDRRPEPRRAEWSHGHAYCAAGVAVPPPEPALSLTPAHTRAPRRACWQLVAAASHAHHSACASQSHRQPPPPHGPRVTSATSTLPPHADSHAPCATRASHRIACERAALCWTCGRPHPLAQARCCRRDTGGGIALGDARGHRPGARARRRSCCDSPLAGPASRVRRRVQWAPLPITTTLHTHTEAVSRSCASLTGTRRVSTPYSPQCAFGDMHIGFGDSRFVQCNASCDPLWASGRR